MREIYIDELYEAYLDDEGFVRLVRTPQRADDLARMTETLAALTAAIRAVTGPSKGRGVLLDLRESPSRNDDEFETATSSSRKLLGASFERVAILVRTQIGKLHIKRLAREDGTSFAIFEDEAAALRHLRGAP